MKSWQLVLMGCVLGLLVLLPRGAQPPTGAPVPDSIAASPPQLEYQRQTLSQADVHILRIPASDRFEVVPRVADGLATVADLAEQTGAIAVLNAGFFDPANRLSTSFVTQQGQIVADPRSNDRLVNNPGLAPYLDRILNRSELRRYRCGQAIRYDITQHDAAAPADCQLLDAIGAGPQLLPQLTLQQEAFVDEVNGAVVRDALGSNQLNARSAIGIAADQSLIWVMVAQQPAAPTHSGISLYGLAELLHQLGAVRALNLDGGSSASLYYEGETVYGRVNAAGDRVVRPVKSVLLLRSA